ncbi:MAG: hypothetical protein KY429_03270 [Actinobacteria bacterium]|nr:hypothetical protein [Actinomycetota bacterium]
MRKLVTALALVALVSSACARGVGTRSEGPIEHPSGGDELVVRVEMVGGFVPAEYHLQNMPLISIFGDGSVIVSGPQIEIFPPPALLNPLIGKVTESEIQGILAEAEEAGLTEGDQTFENDRIADAPTHVFTIVAAGRTSRTSAYALYASETKETDRLREFHEYLTEFAGEADESWTPPRLQLIVFEPVREPSEVEPNRMQWPLSVAPQDFGEPLDSPPFPGASCGVVQGDEAKQLLEVLKGATTITLWVAGDSEYRMIAAPILPDQAGCEFKRL